MIARQTAVILLLIATLVLAACGNSNEPKPTNTPAPLPEALRESLNSAGPPGTNNTNNSLPFAPPSFLDNPEATPEVASDVIVTDFTTLQPGALVTVRGVLTTEDGTLDPAQAEGVLTDENGQQISVVLPPPMLQQDMGETVELSGQIASPPQEGGRLILQVGMTGPASFPPGNPGLPDFLAEASPPPDTQTQEPQVPTRTDFTLPANQTALQTYDSLVEAAGDTLEGFEWINLTGSADISWTFQFRKPDDNSGLLYTVYSDGSVEFISTLFSGGTPIDRSLVKVDSNQIVDRVSESISGHIQLTLSASTENGIRWTVSGSSLAPIDATGQ